MTALEPGSGATPSAGTEELRAALAALQTSLENLDAELFPEVEQWSAEAQSARQAALREWSETARHMDLLIRGLESRQALPPDSQAG